MRKQLKTFFESESLVKVDFDEKNDKRGICSFAHRASYIIFGMNRCFIEGIIEVG